jgi:hypothetical protein
MGRATGPFVRARTNDDHQIHHPRPFSQRRQPTCALQITTVPRAAGRDEAPDWRRASAWESPPPALPCTTTCWPERARAASQAKMSRHGWCDPKSLGARSALWPSLALSGPLASTASNACHGRSELAVAATNLCSVPSATAHTALPKPAL